MSLSFIGSNWRRFLVGACGVITVGLAFPAWRHFYPVTAAKGWDYEVVHSDIPKVSALALDGQNALFVSQELSNGQGKILHLKADGSTTEVLTRLSKPDGQVMFRGGLVTGQEGGTLPVLWLHDGLSEVLFKADNVEGIATDGHVLFAIEDKTPGRLLRYDPDTHDLSVLREGLDEGEGISICPDRRLFYIEKAKGWVKQWQPGGVDTLVADGLNAPGFVQCTEDGLWITEDVTHMARLLLLDSSGNLQVILNHLRAAQTIIRLDPGRYLLAEQGRNRVLEIRKKKTNNP